MKAWKVIHKLRTVGKFETEDEAINFANFFLMFRPLASPHDVKITGYRDGKKVSYRGDED